MKDREKKAKNPWMKDFVIPSRADNSFDIVRYDRIMKAKRRNIRCKGYSE